MLLLLVIVIASVLFLLICESAFNTNKIDADVKDSLKYALKHKIILSEYELVYANKSDPGYFTGKLEMFWFLHDFIDEPSLQKYVYVDSTMKYTQFFIYLKYKSYYSRAIITIVNGKSYCSIEPCDKNEYKGRAKLWKI